MLCGPKGSEQRSQLQCGICGRRTELFELPGRAGRLCLSCSADQAISEQLAIEIDAATLSGQQTENLVAEFAQLSQRLFLSDQRSRSIITGAGSTWSPP